MYSNVCIPINQLYLELMLDFQSSDNLQSYLTLEILKWSLVIYIYYNKMKRSSNIW